MEKFLFSLIFFIHYYSEVIEGSIKCFTVLKEVSNAQKVKNSNIVK